MFSIMVQIHQVRKLHQEVKKKEWDVTLVDSSQGSDTEERDFGKLQSLHWYNSITFSNILRAKPWSVYLSCTVSSGILQRSENSKRNGKKFFFNHDIWPEAMFYK